MSEGLTQAFTTAVNTIKGDVLKMVSTALPAGLSIAGIGIAISLGIKFFRKVAQ